MYRHDEGIHLAEQERLGCLNDQEAERLEYLRKKSKEQFAFFMVFIVTLVASTLATGLLLKSFAIGLVAGLTAWLIKRSNMG